MIINTNSQTGLPLSNIVVSQNFGLTINVAAKATGILITNNYCATSSWYGEENTISALQADPTSICLVQNNIFRRGAVNVTNSSFTNNIMITGTFSGTGNLLANNLGNNTQFGSTNGNKQNVTMSSVFVGTGAGISTDGQYKLKVGSPAIGAGYGSTAGNQIDAGMFGGTRPYILAGLPPVPSVYFFENDPIGSNTDPITVNIKVKSNP